jgi:hypothetical protein
MLSHLVAPCTSSIECIALRQYDPYCSEFLDAAAVNTLISCKGLKNWMMEGPLYIAATDWLRLQAAFPQLRTGFLMRLPNFADSVNRKVARSQTAAAEPCYVQWETKCGFHGRKCLLCHGDWTDFTVAGRSMLDVEFWDKFG